MSVAIKRLRRGGRRLDQLEPEEFGDLHSSDNAVELRPFAQAPGAGVKLHCAVVLVKPGTSGLMVRGYEEHNGAAVLQEWDVRPMKMTVDSGGFERWEAF